MVAALSLTIVSGSIRKFTIIPNANLLFFFYLCKLTVIFFDFISKNQIPSVAARYGGHVMRLHHHKPTEVYVLKRAQVVMRYHLRSASYLFRLAFVSKDVAFRLRLNFVWFAFKLCSENLLVVVKHYGKVSLLSCR